MESKTHTVPKPLWDALEGAFQKKIRELIKDIATTCRQSEKPLWDAYRQSKHTVQLLDLAEPTDGIYECEALCTNTQVYTRCRKTVVFGQKFCAEHEYYHEPPTSALPLLQRCISDTHERFFIHKETNSVYDHEYNKIGLFKDNRIELFEIVD